MYYMYMRNISKSAFQIFGMFSAFSSLKEAYLNNHKINEVESLYEEIYRSWGKEVQFFG